MTSRPTFDYRALSRLVRHRVDMHGLGYRAAAAEIGVTASDLSRISAGQGIVFEKVVAICDWLGIDPRDFYEGPFFASRGAPAAAQPAAPAGVPSSGRARPSARPEAKGPDARSGLPASPDAASTKSDCCSAAHVKQAPAKGGKADRPSRLVPRPAGGAGDEVAGARREAAR